MPGLSRLVTWTRSPPTLAARSATWVGVATTRRRPPPPVGSPPAPPPDAEQPATTRAARHTATSPARGRPIPVPPLVWLLEAVAGHCTAFGNDSHNRDSAAAFAEAKQLQAVVGDGEAGPVGGGGQQRGQTGVDLGWDRVVLDAAAAAAHQVMVVPDQLLGQRVAGLHARRRRPGSG